MSVEIFINIPLEVLSACNPFTPTLSKTTQWIMKGGCVCQPEHISELKIGFSFKSRSHIMCCYLHAFHGLCVPLDYGVSVELPCFPGGGHEKAKQY